MKQYTEQEIRNQRDAVYGHKSSDHNWNECKKLWMTEENIKWLFEQSTYANIKPV